MKHNGESTSIPNVDRLRHHWSTLSSQGARVHIASAKVTYFGLSKSVNYVPESNPPNRLILLSICSGNTQPVRPFFARNHYFSWAALICTHSKAGFEVGFRYRIRIGLNPQRMNSKCRIHPFRLGYNLSIPMLLCA
jgi:hypothetical protein